MPGRPKYRRMKQYIEEHGGEEFIFDQIAEGKPIREVAESLRGCVPDDPDFPSRRMLYFWKDESDERQRKWKEAQRISSHALVEDAGEILENRGEDGEPRPPGDGAEMGWLRMRANHRKYLAEKHNPDKYGEKQKDVNLNVNLGQLHLSALRSKGSMDLNPARETKMLEAEVVEDAAE